MTPKTFKMPLVKPFSLAALGFWLAVVTPSDSFALAQSSAQSFTHPIFSGTSVGHPLVFAQANLAPGSSSGLKPIQPSLGAKPAPLASSGQAVATPAPVPASKPLWQELTPAQQQALKPLGANWATISEPQKRKWLAMSKNFPQMSAAEQAKLHGRMTEWVALSQQQRTQARMNFAETKKLPANEKAAQWQAYQALSPEEKQKLAAKAAPAPTGATAAVKPVPAQKLANVPTTRNRPRAPEVASNAVDHGGKIDHRTLLPRSTGSASGSGDAVPTQKH